MDKTALLKSVKGRLSEKVAGLQHLIDETRASNSDTKSSMGDKYETGREMLQQEINTLQRQLNEAMAQDRSLQQLTDGANKTADFGAVVETGLGLFYIATAVGEIQSGNSRVVTISAESPLAKAMNGRRAGEVFILNSRSQIIKNIW
ncbi:MAG: hypothetical protein K0M63_08220 [Weeksellaceae bacterium]|nr:hypothetical protein [Weeksellaceae bacterium]